MLTYLQTEGARDRVRDKLPGRAVSLKSTTKTTPRETMRGTIKF
jgi:hypothetical protein